MKPGTAGWVRVLLLAGLLACSRATPRNHRDTSSLPRDEHASLSAGFVTGDTAAVQRLLDPQFVVQPPAPDSALAGGPAITYLLGLVNASDLSGSWLEPTTMHREGSFLLEQGVWRLRSGNREVRTRYVLRWRPSQRGWKVVLWRWGRFQ